MESLTEGVEEVDILRVGRAGEARNPGFSGGGGEDLNSLAILLEVCLKQEIDCSSFEKMGTV